MAPRPSLVIAMLLTFVSLRAQDPPAQTPPPPPTAMITGRVVDAGTGLPVESVVVSLAGRPAAAPSPQPIPQAAQPRMLTDSEGRFFFRDLAAGTYSIATAKPGWLAGAFS